MPDSLPYSKYTAVNRLVQPFLIIIATVLFNFKTVSAQIEYCLTSIEAREKMTSVTLKWTHDGSAMYTIYRSTSGPNDGFSEIGMTDNAYSVYMDNTVSVNQMYYYRVESANGCYSPVVNAMPRVRARNMPPSISSQPVTSATVAQNYTYQIQASDPNNNPLQYFLDIAPEGMTVDNSGLIAWTPQQDQERWQWVGVRVTDGYLCTVQYFQVEINSNKPPSVSAGNDTSIVIHQTLLTNAIVSDDGLPTPSILSYTWRKISGPGDVLFSDSTDLNTFISINDAGNYFVCLSCTDGEKQTIDTVCITTFESYCKPITADTLLFDRSEYKYRIYSLWQGPSTFGEYGFNDSTFLLGNGSFGSHGGCPMQNQVATYWPLNTDIVLRKWVYFPRGITNLHVFIAIDNDNNVMINEHSITGGMVTHENCPYLNDFYFNVPSSVLNVGRNLIAILARDRGVESFLDIRIIADIIPPPVSFTGPDKIVDPGILVTLGDSTDLLLYECETEIIWNQIAGPHVTLDLSNPLKP